MRVAIDLDALGDTRPLWRDWLHDVARVLDVSGLPDNRIAAGVELDARGAGNWRTLLERFAEDHAPVYLRRAAEVSATLRALKARGAEIVVFTDAPVELAHVALRHLGAERRVERVESAPPAADVVVRSPEELLQLRGSA